MPVYNAPEIKDRVATGDDLYTITDVGGKKKLTPSPTEVSEPGTAINKALLQDIVDALQGATENFVPYEDYWWRTRQVSGGYTLKIMSLQEYDGGYYHERISYVDGTSTEFDAIRITQAVNETGNSSDGQSNYTIKYASNITMNSSGVISLVNPTTITVNGDNVESYQSVLRGKYVTGFMEGSSNVYKIGTYASITLWKPNPMSYGSYTRHTYYWGYRASSVTSLPAEIAQAAYTDSSSPTFSYLSNSNSDFYPHSGTSSGTEYQYLGRISDFAPPVAPYNMKTANITSASWNNKAYSVPIPAARYFVTWVTGSYKFIGIVDNLKMYGIAYTSKSSWSVQTGDSSVTLGAATSTPQTNALEFTYSETSSAPVVTINYLPLA